MLGDVDRQQSSRLWLGLRPPAARPITTWETDADHIAKPPKGTTHVVLDTPAGLDEASLGPLRSIAFDAYCRFRERAATTHQFMIDVETAIQLPSLLHMEDRASMRYSVESRVPFCTAAVMEVARRGRLEWAFADGKPKGLLRDVFADVIPPSILKRREKVGRPIPFRTWLAGTRGAPYLADLRRRQGEFRDLLGVDFVAHGLEHANPFDRTAWAMVSSPPATPAPTTTASGRRAGSRCGRTSGSSGRTVSDPPSQPAPPSGCGGPRSACGRPSRSTPGRAARSA